MAEFNIVPWEKVLYDDKGNVFIFAFVIKEDGKVVLEYVGKNFANGKDLELPVDFNSALVFNVANLFFWYKMPINETNISAMTATYAQVVLNYLDDLLEPLTFNNGDKTGTIWRMN